MAATFSACSLARISLESAFHMKILIVPVGHVPPEKFRRACNEIKAAGSCIEMHNLGFQKSANSPFKMLSWHNGKIHFEFLEGKEMMSASTDWARIHVADRILGVIGVCHCPCCPNLNEIYEEFLELKEQMLMTYSHSIEFRCYAFEPLDSHANDDSLAREDLIMFPPQEDRLCHYIRDIFNDMAAHIFYSIEAYVNKLPTNIFLETPLDDQDLVARQKKFGAGRRQKHLGDYALLCGSPLDAFRHYKMSLELTKANQDIIWHGAALEAHASTVLSMNLFNSTMDDNNGNLMNELQIQKQVIDLCQEAVLCFRKVEYGSYLVISAAFKLCRYLIKINLRNEAGGILRTIWELRGDCSAQDQIAITVEAGIMCQKMGFERMYGFYLVHAADVYMTLRQYESASALMRLAGSVYGLGSLCQALNRADILKVTSPPGESKSEIQVDVKKFSARKCRERGFSKYSTPNVRLQISLIINMIKALKASGDAHSTIITALYALRTLHPWLSKAVQKWFSEELVHCTRLLPLNTPVELSPIPTVCQIEPIELSPSLAPCERIITDTSLQEENKNNVFVFRPGSAANSSSKEALKLRYVEDASLDVAVYLSNPLAIDIQIQSLCLWTNGVKFEAFSTSLWLPAGSLRHRVILSGKAYETGQLKIKGCIVKAFNIQSAHKVDRFGLGKRHPEAPPEFTYMETHSTDPFSTVPSSVFHKGHESSYRKPQFSSDHKKPLSTAQMESCGAFAYVGSGAKQECERSESSSSGDAKYDLSNILITPALPLIALTSLFRAANRPLSDQSKLLFGERRDLDLFVENVGSLAVADLNVIIKIRFSSSSMQGQMSYYSEEERRLFGYSTSDSESDRHDNQSIQLGKRKFLLLPDLRSVIKKALPLLPGHSFSIPVRILAHPDCCGIDIRLEYAERSQCSNYRAIERQIRWEVNQGIKVHNCSILPFGQDDGGSHRRIDHIQKEDRKLISFVKAQNECTNDSTNFGETKAFAVSMSQLNLTGFAQDGRDALLILELENTTTYAFEITTLAKSSASCPSIMLPEQCYKRIILPVSRFSFGKANNTALRHLKHVSELNTTNKPSAFVSQGDKSAEVNFLKKSLQQCERLFADKVRIQWQTDNLHHGLLQGLEKHLSVQDLLHLVPDPVQIDFGLPAVSDAFLAQKGDCVIAEINKNDSLSSSEPNANFDLTDQNSSDGGFFLTPSSQSLTTQHASVSPRIDPLMTQANVVAQKNRFRVGEFRPIRIQITNSSKVRTLTDLRLHIVPYQESVNGGLDTNLEHKMLWIGTWLPDVPPIAPSRTYTHSVNVCFMTVGRFRFHVTCSSSAGNGKSEGSIHASPRHFVIQALA